jgi:biotin transport system substrate-specific component
MKAHRKLFLVYGALFAALISAGAFVSVPLPFSPVPIVLQNFFVVLAGLVLGPLWGAFSVALFLLAGALGVPVFAGASGGIAVFARPTGGFLLGYLPGAFLSGLLAGSPQVLKEKEKRFGAVPKCQILELQPMKTAKAGSKITNFGTGSFTLSIAAAAGFLVIYIPGLLRLTSVLGGNRTAALAAGFFPFIPGDFLKAVLAVLSAPRLRRLVSRRLYG